MGPLPCGQLILKEAGKNIQWKKSLFNKWCRDNWTATNRRMKLNHFLTLYTKIDTKWLKDLNVRQESIKILRGKHRQQPLQPSLQQLLTRHPSKGKENKGKNELLRFIKIKSFCTAKERVNKTKRQLTIWKNISANVL